jgi:hypothetical protein
MLMGVVMCLLKVVEEYAGGLLAEISLEVK